MFSSEIDELGKLTPLPWGGYVAAATKGRVPQLRSWRFPFGLLRGNDTIIGGVRLFSLKCFRNRRKTELWEKIHWADERDLGLGSWWEIAGPKLREL